MTTTTENAIAKAAIFNGQKKSAGVAYLLWFFLSPLWAHRIYLGMAKSAVWMMFLVIFGFISMFSDAPNKMTTGLLAVIGATIWLFADLFRINGWVTQHNDRLAAKLGMLKND
jgi:TM2 domain-containing membrane protein YozV